MDYTVGTSLVRILAGSTTPENVIITFRVDGIAQEPDETLSLQLLPLTSGPMGDAIFFRDLITLTIIDSDSELTFVCLCLNYLFYCEALVRS